MSDPAGRFTITIEQTDGFEFRTRFDKEHYPELVMDEPAPLGRDTAPNPARILAAAIGDCLAASLLFCMKRARIPVHGIAATVEVEIVRNERRRLRIGTVNVKLAPRLGGDPQAQLACLEAFEDFCVVTQSVRAGIDVRVAVEPA